MRQTHSELPETEVLTLLAKRRRRLLLRALRDASAPLSTRELAERIADRERDAPADDDLRAVRITLRHNHLPRLDDAGVIAYDEAAGSVTPSGHFDSLVRAMEGVTERERPWSGG